MINAEWQIVLRLILIITAAAYRLKKKKKKKRRAGVLLSVNRDGLICIMCIKIHGQSDQLLLLRRRKFQRKIGIEALENRKKKKYRANVETEPICLAAHCWLMPSLLSAGGPPGPAVSAYKCCQCPLSNAIEEAWLPANLRLATTAAAFYLNYYTLLLKISCKYQVR